MNKLVRSISVLLAVAIVIPVFAGCAQFSQKGKTRKIVDVTGAEVEIPSEVKRVVNLYSFGCQMMIGLGLEEYLVGVNEDMFETEWIEMMCPESKNIPTLRFWYRVADMALKKISRKWLWIRCIERHL